MERDKIIKALECCHISSSDCLSCPFIEDNKSCASVSLMALALIKELTEENEYLKQQNEIYAVLNKKLEDACESYAWTYGTAISKELFLKKERANTVREMQKRLTDRDEFSLRADYDGIYYIDHACWVNQVAAEILGEE